MMREANYTPFLTATLALVLAGQVAGAQESGESQVPEEELEMIDLEAERNRSQPDDGLEGIEYDEATRSYRLVIDDEGDEPLRVTRTAHLVGPPGEFEELDGYGDWDGPIQVFESRGQPTKRCSATR